MLMNEILGNALQRLIARWNGMRKIDDICKSFMDCSEYQINNEPQPHFLVQNKMKVINYDTLTKWLYENEIENPTSSDVMCNSPDYLYFIEFKAGKQGNQVIGKQTYSKNRLLKNVANKINDSYRTAIDKIFDSNERNKIRFRFRLVVDSKEIGPDAQARILASLSTSQNTIRNPEFKQLMEKTYSYLNMPEYALDSYESIDIWYSGLFDYHVRNARINDASYLYQDVRYTQRHN